MKLGPVGRAVEVQLRPPVTVKLQPSVVSARGRVTSGEGGYIWAPIPTHRDMTNPDKSPDKAPCKTFLITEKAQIALVGEQVVGYRNYIIMNAKINPYVSQFIERKFKN